MEDSASIYSFGPASRQPLLQREEVSIHKTVRLFIAVSVVAVGSSFQFGFGTAALNNLDVVMPESLKRAGHPITLLQWSLVVSGFSIGGLFGSSLVPCLSANLGRKTILLANNVLVFASSGLLMLGRSWPILLIGRVLIGTVAGIATGVVPMYFAEICPGHARGAVGTAHQLGITVGILTAQAFTTPSLGMLGPADDEWRYAFLVPVFCSLLECIVLPFCTESPAYAYQMGGSSAALAKLEELHTSPSVASHIEQIRGDATAGTMEGTFSLQQLLASRPLRRQLLVGVVIMLSMQLSGIDVIYYYSTLIFRSAGVLDPQMATTSLGLLNVLLTLLSVYMMHRAGRRALLLGSWCGMCFSACVLTAAFSAARLLSTGALHALAVSAMAISLVAFAIGPGCIAWFVIAEMFPPHARDAVMALGISLNWMANWVVAIAFPTMHALLGPQTFIFFAFAAAGFGAFTHRYVPETMGRTHAQVTTDLDSRFEGDHAPQVFGRPSNGAGWRFG